MRPKVAVQANTGFEHKKTVKAVAATALTVVSLMAASGAEAALLARDFGGNGTVDGYYDSDLKITWLKNANAFDGLATWRGATAAIRNLDVEGITGWRLPGSNPNANIPSDLRHQSVRFLATYNWNVPVSEMEYLFFNELGGVVNSSIIAIHNADTFDLFTNLQGGTYWTRDADEPNPLQCAGSCDLFVAFTFDFGDGEARFYDNQKSLLGWAVHDGDVGASPVPMPATVFLLAPALAGLGFMHRRAA